MQNLKFFLGLKQTLIFQDLDFQKSKCRLKGWVLIVSKTWILQMGFCHENWLNFAVEFCRIFSSIHFLSLEKKVFVHSITIIVTWGYPTSNSFLQLILFYFLLIFLWTWLICKSNYYTIVWMTLSSSTVFLYTYGILKDNV